MLWIKTLYRISYKIYFVCTCLGVCRWRGLGSMRIFVVRIYYVDTNIFVDIFTGFPKFTLVYSIDAFTFVVCVFLVNIGRKADIVSFVIASLKRLWVVGTFSISGVGQVRFVSMRSIRCSTRRWISGERGDEVFGLFDFFYEICQIFIIF